MKKKVLSLFKIILLIFLLGVFIFSAWRLYQIVSEYRSAEAGYSDLDKYISSDDPEPADGEYADIVWPTVDFDALRQINPDIVGWIFIEGTGISYPVVQGQDNEYYLKHMFDGTYNSSGCIFLDAGVPSDFTADNSVLYGHHMRNGSMFAGLVNYKEQAYYDEHSVGLLITPEQRYVVRFFSGYVIKSDGISWESDFTPEQFRDWLDDISSKSWFESGIVPTADDRILTLSTCSYEFDNARYVLHGIITAVGD